MAKWPKHFISGKQFQKRSNLADLAFKKAKWQPCHNCKVVGSNLDGNGVKARPGLISTSNQ